MYVHIGNTNRTILTGESPVRGICAGVGFYEDLEREYGGYI